MLCPALRCICVRPTSLFPANFIKPQFPGSCVISLKIVTGLFTATQVEAEEDETVWGLKERWALITGLPMQMTDRLSYRGKLLQDEKKLKEEGLVGGETLSCQEISLRPNDYTPDISHC
jgi:hypothetical protein